MGKANIGRQIEFLEAMCQMHTVMLTGERKEILLEAIKSLQKLQKKPPKVQQAEEERKLNNWGEFVAAYTIMYESETPLRMKLSPAEWKCLRRLVERFVDSVPDQNESEALHAWELLMSNWSQLNTFLRGQFKPFQLEKYLDEIAQKFRSGTAKANAESAKDSRQELRNYLTS